MLRTIKHIATAMFMAPDGYLRQQIICGVKRENSPSFKGWENPANGSCIGGNV